MAARNPALAADLRAAGRSFDLSHSITTILSHNQTAISCLDYNSLGLRSSHKVVEVDKDEFQRAVEEVRRRREARQQQHPVS